MQIQAMSLEDLMFCDGLSSRFGANEISGRGVGLGAVKTELEKLGGTALVETELGVGTRLVVSFADHSGSVRPQRSSHGDNNVEHG